MSRKKPLLILVDGSSYLYRAFHALPPLTNSRQEPTGAIYGVINMLRKLLNEQQPDYIAIVFDPKGKTFRHDRYADYKANRPAMPTELQQQIAPLHAIIRAMGLPLLIVDHYEADDVIGTLAKAAEKEAMRVLISTGDKDLTQLVNSHITLINTMTNTTLDRQGVKEKFGVPPERIVDYLTLIGDSSDNVPGVPKVGPKTAVKWLSEYSTLDNLIKKADHITGKVGENLRAHLPQIPLAKSLVTIHTTIALPIHVTALVQQTPDNEKLRALFKQMEFKTWLSELSDEPKNEKTHSTTYQTILSSKDFERWFERLKKEKIFSLDTETTSLNAIDAELVGLSFSFRAGEAVYIPVGHTYDGVPTQLSRDAILSALKPILTDSKYKKIGHHIKYDLNVLENYHISLQGIAFDTMLASYVLNSTSSRHDMDSLALAHLNYQTISFEDVAGKGAKQLTFDQVPLEKAGFYAAEDADITFRLYEFFNPQITADPGLLNVFSDIEMPLLSVLARMERYGVLIDAEKLSQQSHTLGERIATLEKEAHHVAGCVFNLNSPKQLQEILYQKLKLPILEKTATGQASTAESVLQELAFNYPLPHLILEYRRLTKLKSTYTDQLPKQINSRTGRVHTSYNQAVAATGRLSSTDPNLQNIPIRTPEGRRIREAFMAPMNHVLISADYSQVELRIMAHLSQDNNLIRAFEQGLDVHQATAAEIFGVPLEAVTPEQRRRAKTINFGLIYGMSAFGLARQLNLERDAAADYIHLYFERYPGVKAYMDNTRTKAHQQGFVETIFGRRLYLPEINSRQIPRQRAAERTAINAPLQGSAADLIKLAMIKIDHRIIKEKINMRMIMQVHDELVFEVPCELAETVIPLIRRDMCETVRLNVPIAVEIGVGENWRAAHD